MWRGTFLPPNRSISNITGWNLVEPTSGEIPRLFWFQKIQKSPKWGPKFQGRVIPGKKRPLPGMHHTEVRSGDGHQNPNIQISRYPDVQMSGYPDIRYQIPDIRYQKNKWTYVFPKSQEKVPTNRANWSYDPIDPSGDLVFYYCFFLGCFGENSFLDEIPCRLGRASEPIWQRLIWMCWMFGETGLAWVSIRSTDEKARDLIGSLTVDIIDVYIEPALLINAVRNTFSRKFMSKCPAKTFQAPSQWSHARAPGVNSAVHPSPLMLFWDKKTHFAPFII